MDTSEILSRPCLKATSFHLSEHLFNQHGSHLRSAVTQKQRLKALESGAAWVSEWQGNLDGCRVLKKLNLPQENCELCYEHPRSLPALSVNLTHRPKGPGTLRGQLGSKARKGFH